MGLVRACTLYNDVAKIFYTILMSRSYSRSRPGLGSKSNVTSQACMVCEVRCKFVHGRVKVPVDTSCVHAVHRFSSLEPSLCLEIFVEEYKFWTRHKR